MKPRAWTKWALLCCLIVGSYGAIDPVDPRWSGFDFHRYEAMRAAAPGFAAVRAPEAFRLLAPWIAALVGWPLLSYGSLAACFALLWTWLRDEGLSETGAGIALTMFASSHFFVGEIVWDPYQSGDAIGLAAMLGALCAVQSRRWWLFSLVLAAGCLARETPVLAVPYALAAIPTAWIRIALGALAAFAVLAALHLLVPHSDGLSLYQAVRSFAPAKLSGCALGRDFGAFAPALVVPLLSLRAARSAFRWEHAVLVISVVAASVAGADVERLMLPAAPAVLFLAGKIAERWSTLPRIALVAAGIVGSPHHLMTRWPLPSRAWTVALTLLSCAVAASAVLVADRAGQRSVTNA